MTLILKPKGRGNWTPLVVTIQGERATPLLINRGQTLQLGGVTYRIHKVPP